MISSKNRDFPLHTTCCFTGHGPQGRSIKMDEDHIDFINLVLKIRKIIIELIEEWKVTHFICSMALGIDLYVAEIVLGLKKTYPDISLECALPYETQADRWTKFQRERYASIIARCDQKTLLQKQYTYDCLQNCDKYMVEHAGFVLAVWNGRSSRTGKTVAYAQTLNRTVFVLHPTTLMITL